MSFDLQILMLFACIFIVAMMYASVGHGGASGYLAVLGLFEISFLEMKVSVLLLNVLVSAVATLHYIKSGYFRGSLFWPFAIGSIPASFIGSSYDIDPLWYKKILGVCLLFSVIHLMNWIPSLTSFHVRFRWWMALLVGCSIGFISGMIGIGGGILLSPLILLFGWADMKETAAVSAPFILVNSLAGIAGVGFNRWPKMDPMFYGLLVVALVGGALGAYAGAFRMNRQWLIRILSVVLLIASFKLLLL